MAVFQEGRQPLFAKKQWDKGQVWYVAYDVLLNPMASWNGNADLWDRVVQPHSSPASMKGGAYNPVNQFWELQNILNLFPSIHPPSFFLLLVVFLIYAVLAAPFLYFVLKFIDKREWAWVVTVSIQL